LSKHYIFDDVIFENPPRDSNSITRETAKALLSPDHLEDLLERKIPPYLR